MAFKDTASSGALTPFVWQAAAAVATVAVIPRLPGHAFKMPSTLVPISVIIDNTGGTNTDVEIEVSTSSSFGTVFVTLTSSNKPNGVLTLNASGLSDDTTYWWRARGAPTGTSSWGPWSSDTAGGERSFTVDLDTGRGYGYVMANIGLDSTLVDNSAADVVMMNVGVEVTLADLGHHYVMVNIGVPRVPWDAGHHHVYEGDVSDNDPVPHLWFLWRPYGFAGDEVWAYGHGFGNPQAEYGGAMMLDPGPDYGTADVAAGVLEWYEQIAGPDAYTEDRRIWPGSFDTPPDVDTEAGIVRFEAPVIIMPPGELPYTHLAYVTHSEGASNKVNWVMYPTIPVAAGSLRHGVVPSSSMRLSAPTEPSGIEQLYFFTEVPEYVITHGRAERPPAFTGSATGVAQLGTTTTEDDLSDALEVDLGATHRWLPDEATLTPRPDLGTGVVVWDAIDGSTTKGWRLDGDTSPYVDAAYAIPSRMGELDRPAMIFPGDAFASLTGLVSSGPAFTIAIVAVVHAPDTGRGTIFSTFRDSPDPDEYDWEIYHQSDRMKLAIGGMYADRNLNTDSGRPVIVVGSVSGTQSRLVLIDQSPSSHVTSNPAMSAATNKAYLARSWRTALDEIDFATMDVLDVAWWDAGMTMAQMQAVASQLDGIYGVTG